MTSKEVAEAEGDAPERPGYDALAQRATQLRAVVDQPSAKEAAAQELARIEQQLATRREDDGRAAAQARLTGIRRGVGSLLNEYGRDRERLRRALRDGWEGWTGPPVSARDAIEGLNARADQIRGLHVEAAALCDRFALALPTLGLPREPEAEIDLALPACWRHEPARPAIETDGTVLKRERRTYQEVDGSDAYRIIVAAGLQPWPALTPAQQAALDEHAEDKRQEQEAMQEFAREAARIPRELPGGGGVGLGRS